MDYTRYKKATCNTKSNWRVFFNFLKCFFPLASSTSRCWSRNGKTSWGVLGWGPEEAKPQCPEFNGKAGHVSHQTYCGILVDNQDKQHVLKTHEKKTGRKHQSCERCARECLPNSSWHGSCCQASGSQHQRKGEDPRQGNLYSTYKHIAKHVLRDRSIPQVRGWQLTIRIAITSKGNREATQNHWQVSRDARVEGEIILFAYGCLNAFTQWPPHICIEKVQDFITSRVASDITDVPKHFQRHQRSIWHIWNSSKRDLNRRLQGFIKKVHNLFLDDYAVTFHCALSTSNVEVLHLVQHQLMFLHFPHAQPETRQSTDSCTNHIRGHFIHHERDQAWKPWIQIQLVRLDSSNIQGAHHQSQKSEARQDPQGHPDWHKAYGPCWRSFHINSDLIIAPESLPVGVIPNHQHLFWLSYEGGNSLEGSWLHLRIGWMDTDMIDPKPTRVQQVSKEIRAQKHQERPQQKKTVPQCWILLCHCGDATCT